MRTLLVVIFGLQMFCPFVPAFCCMDPLHLIRSDGCRWLPGWVGCPLKHPRDSTESQDSEPRERARGRRAPVDDDDDEEEVDEAPPPKRRRDRDSSAE